MLTFPDLAAIGLTATTRPRSLSERDHLLNLRLVPTHHSWPGTAAIKAGPVDSSAPHFGHSVTSMNDNTDQWCNVARAIVYPKEKADLATGLKSLGEDA